MVEELPIFLSALVVLPIFIAIMVFLAIAVGIFLFVFWIMMIVDCATRKFKEHNDKLVWMIVIVFLQLIGALIYYFVVKRNNKR